MNVLHICASPKPIDQSASKQLAAAFFTKLAEVNTDINVTNVDLYSSGNTPPFLSYAAYRGLWQPIYEPGYQPTAAEMKATEYGKNQAQQLRDTDILVLTMPLWNGGMPAVMKSWIDQAMVPNVLFTYDAQGPHPSHQIRKVIMLVSSGAVLKEDDPGDALTPQVEAAMRFIGVSDIVVAWADGQDPITCSDGALRKQMAIEAAQELAEETAQTTL